MENRGKAYGLLQTIKGVLAGFLGVQSSAQQEEDFTKGKVSTYIIVGILFVVVFIFSVIGVVQWVLSNAGNQ